ncbi:MAG: hypothetical protein WC634_05670 [archaeon]
MVTKLVGVAHSPGYAKIVVEKLAGLKADETVALEICPKEAALFEEIYASNGNAIQSILDFTREAIDTASAIVKRKTGIEISSSRKFSNATAYSMGVYFYYRIFEHAKSKGAKCIPLDSNSGSEKVTQFKFANRRKEQEQLIWPVRERQWIRRVIKTNPDYAVFGHGHLKAVRYWLAKRGHPAIVLYKERTRRSSPDIRKMKARKAYRQRGQRRTQKLGRSQARL